jgi:hypothetical protein
MPRTRCAFCDHENPSASRFCNQCGSMLHLVPCTQCEAINNEAYATCYRCGAELAPQKPIAQAVAQANADAERAYAIEALGRPLAPSPPRSPPPAVTRTPVEPTLAPAPVASPDSTNGAPRQAFVVPPDEERLAAARSVAADARRRRLYRSAVIAALVVAAAPVVYYEFFPRDPLSVWLRAIQVDVVNAIRQHTRGAAPTEEAPRAPQAVVMPAAPAVAPSSGTPTAPSAENPGVANEPKS